MSNFNEINHTAEQSINELVTSLSEGERTTFHDIISSVEIPSSAFENCASWSKDSYTRNCIFDDEKYELILLCWEPGQITPIHDHGGEECWVRVIEGEFREKIFKMDDSGELQTIKSSTSKAGDISYMVDFMGCHSLENLSSTRSMSLHLYAKPIRNCNIFDVDSNEFVRRELEYDTVSELIQY
jgi:cysteine dioxygenase